jgi:hypothetical protein
LRVTWCDRPLHGDGTVLQSVTGSIFLVVSGPNRQKSRRNEPCWSPFHHGHTVAVYLGDTGRVCSRLSGSLVLVVLLCEITKLYAQRRRAARARAELLAILEQKNQALEAANAEPQTDGQDYQSRAILPLAERYLERRPGA